MDFKTAYQQAIKFEGYQADADQAGVVDQLDYLFKNLLNHAAQDTMIQRAWSLLTGKRSVDQHKLGCYMWGGVGRGKTWLMDLFYQTIPFKDKSRLHFHEFMQQIHLRLKKINGQRDPLVTIAEDIAMQTRVICLDEFHVSDITDAMLLYGLLDALYRKGAILLMTSNIRPDELYKNGLQRSRFLPAIELIKKRSLVIEVTGDKDFRLNGSEDNLNYISPLSPDTDAWLETRFHKFSCGAVTYDAGVAINNREINFRMMSTNIIWFDFAEICGGPRAASDYLYLANHFDYVVVSNVFRMDERHDDFAKRFINLVDALYDRQVGLIVSATGWPEDLYAGQLLRDDFRRTASRLEELRSRLYDGLDRSVLQDRNSLLTR